MKRKNSSEANGHSDKKPATKATSLRTNFRGDLFDSETVSDFAHQYAQSTPSKHAVVSDLINDELLHAVRNEIRENIQFTAKETDIYKIHQSGDLANLDGLPVSALAKLPSLLTLRDAMYSSEFRQWVSSVSGSGPLSGKKTDMAVNVYVPGCHLLCHDDVIGSRRVSYILYLHDPDKPWQATWGGALRLYPTDEVKDQTGKAFKVPRPDWVRSIPPDWNQLSFFAVQPGESFHDVEEVYKRQAGESEDDGGRIRMAISGWFHIPQEGEDGYEPGLEERLAERSSLQQLQGNADGLDEPRPRWIPASQLPTDDADGAGELTEEDLQFLLQFMSPNYLTPDTVEELNELFTEQSALQLRGVLNKRFASELEKSLLAESDKYDWAVSRPPHKHRYQYIQSSSTEVLDDISASAPLRAVLDILLPNAAFGKWLALVTGLKIKSSSLLARRFRRGLDYELAQGYEDEDPQLEFTLCVTPTQGWGAEDDDDDDDDDGDDGDALEVDTKHKNSKNKEAESNDDEDNVGGYEIFMAGDDDGDDERSNDGVLLPSSSKSHTGAGERRSAKKKKADPAVYQAAGENEDDGILFSNAAAWNTMSIVLRDQGILKFVKYVSKSAPGDRFDITGCVKVDMDDEDDG